MKMNESELSKLKNWFLNGCRDLPWRIDPTPYAVWVSEVMLQQTQVSVVIPYFERWMTSFPNIDTLAKAPLDVVIKQWEGLGYYSRARNLHEGARYVMQHFHGQLPSSAQELSQIKGLGPYTIGAILSFAFHQRAAAVDGNVLRVLARYFHIEGAIDKPSTVKQIRELAEDLLPTHEPWIISEALIELGAVTCQKKPNCLACPLKASCKGYLNGKAELLPNRSPRKATEYLYRAVAVMIADNHLLLKRGEQGQIMSDLYEFPYFEVEKDSSLQELQRTIQAFYPEASFQSTLKEVSHSFTRYQVRLSPLLYHVEEPIYQQGYQWIPFSQLPQLAFSSGHRRLLEQLLKQQNI